VLQRADRVIEQARHMHAALGHVAAAVRTEIN
jgi:hypothetical protein